MVSYVKDENVLLQIMSLYKKKEGEVGKQKVKDLMLISLQDPTSTLDENDMVVVQQFIDDNWDNV